MSLSSNYPTVRPSLLLDFAKSRTVDPRITFTRASTATYFDEDGILQSALAGVPRIDFNPSTLVCNGLLIEDQRTNSILQSEDFSTTWSITGTASISTNVTSSPAGTITADKFILGNTITSGSAAFFQSVTKAATATTYTTSVFVKAAEFNSLRLILRDTATAGNNVEAYFNAATGAIAFGPTANGTFTGASATISAVGNGWYRVTLTGTTSTETSVNVRMLVYQNGTGTATGNGSDGILIWGAQLEAGAFPTSYIPTTTTALTRNADVASMTGTNFSSWYNASEGTLYAEGFVYTAPANTVNPCLFSIDDNTGSNRIQLYRANGNGNPNAGLAVVNGGTIQALITAGNTQFQNGKIAGAYKVNDFAASVNGATPVTDSSGTVPVVTQMQIGIGPALANVNGTIRRLAYYPTRLANAQLVALTG